MVEGFFPQLGCFVAGTALAEVIDFLRPGDSAYRHRHPISGPSAVHDVFKEKRFAVFFAQAAELPADKGMQEGVFVYLPLDSDQFAVLM
jgi:hypothetical protein